MSARTGVTEDDVVLLRAGSGTIHLGVRIGRVHDTFCCTIIDSDHVRTWDEREAARERVLEQKQRFVCEQCCQIAEKPWPIIRRITGW